MTEKVKLKGELEILESISKLQRGYPNWMAVDSGNQETTVTQRFIDEMENLQYPLEVIEGMKVENEKFKDAIEFLGDFYQLHNDERYSYYRVSGIDEVIVIVKFGSQYRPNLHFISWLERERPNFRRNAPPYMEFPPEKPRWGNEITWYEKEMNLFAELNQFKLEEFILPKMV